MEGQWALVTGASRGQSGGSDVRQSIFSKDMAKAQALSAAGVGAAIAERFAQEGANLCLAARTTEKLEQVHTPCLAFSTCLLLIRQH